MKTSRFNTTKTKHLLLKIDLPPKVLEDCALGGMSMQQIKEVMSIGALNALYADIERRLAIRSEIMSPGRLKHSRRVLKDKWEVSARERMPEAFGAPAEENADGIPFVDLDALQKRTPEQLAHDARVSRAKLDALLKSRGAPGLDLESEIV